ncbi:hypothetical protein [Piscibacillus halophilus]|uniref:Uncharacterized protein n=1 Tax=Piscibacillus halophilus TaxID=571933 RepID=A0A1H9K2J3_9BACI|nr:hypothetical protein [Piscibacillus halophilus]SEQ93299.1 hypothetical protein SAMN05216362_1359 [Piscibacillus halophilus]
MLLGINWYDWITPTTPFAAVVIGILFSMLIAFMVWYESREWKVFFAFLGLGVGVTLVGAGILDFFGYFN